jgi:DnaK suppressor protein
MALTKAEINKFKKELERLRSQISHTLKGSTEDVKNPDETGLYTQHQADKGTDDFDRTISLEVTSREYAILKYIDRALQKIQENTYGTCDITGKEIPKARLNAVPYATMTVEAQEKLEKGLL